MTPAPDSIVTISRLQIHGAGDVSDWLPRTVATLRGAEISPTEINLVSSCEANILRSGRTRQLLRELILMWPRARVVLVHQGCAGFYAAVSRFAHGCADRVLVICDENEAALAQACLDSAGIGRNTVENGLQVVCGLAVAWLERRSIDSLAPSDLCVTRCRIFAKSHGLGGTPLFLQKLQTAIADAVSDGCTLPVSFAIAAPWSDTLLDGMSGAMRTPWLPSAETTSEHLLSLKPLYELQSYGDILDSTPLLIMTLSGGGRLGMMRVARQPIGVSTSIGGDGRGAVEIGLPLIQEHVDERALQQMHYIEDRYRGIDDLFFVSHVEAADGRPGGRFSISS